MGAFCVFGVSRSKCRKAAERKIPVLKHHTIEMWATLVRDMTDNLFSNIETRQEKISPELDAPQFCRDWIAAQPGDVRNTKIMYRGPKIDKHGGTVMKGGQPVMTWIEFDESRPIPRPFGES